MARARRTLTTSRLSDLDNDRQTTPKLLRVSLYTLFVVAAVASLPQIGRYSPLPMTTLLDVWIIAFIATSLVRGRIASTGLLLVLSAYLLTRAVPALAMGAPAEDFLQAYRWILYLIAFAIAIGRDWGPIRPLITVTWLLLAMATAKAFVTRISGQGWDRPGLLLENNFELALFAGMIAVAYRYLGPKERAGMLVLMGALTLVSGSRSGAIAFVILALFAVSQLRISNLFVRYLLFCALPLVALVPLSVFETRTETVRIDRLNFLDVFFAEVQEWNALQWLVGNIPLTPLQPGSCASLAFYDELFSSTGDGSCYSVILHAFVMRVILDAGIFGLILAFGVAIYSMRRAGATIGLTVCLVLIAVTNSLSVSGLNNPYVALPILLAVLMAGSRQSQVGSGASSPAAMTRS